MIEQLLSPAAWGSPVGLGIFILCLALSVNIVSKSGKDDEFWKMMKENMKEKNSDKKSRK